MVFTRWAPLDSESSDLSFPFEEMHKLDKIYKDIILKKGLFVKIDCQNNKFTNLLSSSDWQYWDYFYNGMMIFKQGGNYFVASIGSGNGGTYIVKEIENDYFIQQIGGREITYNKIKAHKIVDLIIEEISQVMSIILDIKLSSDHIDNFSIIIKNGRLLIARS